MKSTESTEIWTDKQQLYIRFLAAGKTDTTGTKWTKEDFARKVLGMSPEALYKWQRLPGFGVAVFEETMSRVSEYFPDMLKAQAAKAIKRQDTTAFMAIMRQAGMLKADKTETKTEHSGEVSFTNQVPIT